MANDNVMLPTGDYLRQLIGQTDVRSSELKLIVRRRGIFTCDDDKKITGPIIIKTGLSPYEYLELRDSYKTKEESPKFKTRSTAWKSDSPLLDCIPDESIDYKSLLNDQFGVCQLVSPPYFVAENSNPNHIVMEFEISRSDLTKNFGQNTTFHKGRVEFKKSGGGTDVVLSLTHTSKETKDFANKVSNAVIKHFKSEGHINQDEEMKSIKFSDFNNENRVKFMNELTQVAAYSKLKFIDTNDIHFAPDLLKTPPKNLDWMKDKIEDLKLKGKGLHSTFFVNDKEYHEFIKLYGMNCEYIFECDGYSGTCKILFEFSESDDVMDGAELTLNIVMIKIEINESGVSKVDAKKEILESIEKCKMELYDKYRLPKE
jgi:hypothetical protein